MKDFLKAKKLLADDVNLVLIKDDKIIKSAEKGIAFLVALAAENKYQGYSAADRIIGKAAAFLYCRMNIKNVYGEVMSEKAFEILNKAKINVEYKIITENIKNRTDTGLCPMEMTVLNIEDKEEAFRALKNKIQQ